jgi:threonine/homoserine/homoserine lactone efflux protein
MINILISGLSTGLILQLAIGPVFIFIANIVIQGSLINGLSAAIAVAIVDYLYIVLSIIGTGKILEKQKFKKLSGFLSSSVLLLFGVIMVFPILICNTAETIEFKYPSTFIPSFISAFLLTLSNPLTIFFWTGLFTTKSIAYKYNKRELMLFGLSAGFATIVFLGTSAILISLIKPNIPLAILKYLNILVGIILILYGIRGLLNSKNMKKTH